MPKSSTTSQALVINRPVIKTIHTKIIGTSPLIIHKFSEKSKREMLEKQQKKASKAKQVRDPESEYEGATYYNSDKKDAIPATMVKSAMVGACRFLGNDVKMTIIRGAVFVKGDPENLIELKYKEKNMREDTVVIGMGSKDLRYRPEYVGWSVELQIDYLSDVITAEQVLSLLEYAGFSQGLGEYRTGKTSGNFGAFTILTE